MWPRSSSSAAPVVGSSVVLRRVSTCSISAASAGPSPSCRSRRSRRRSSSRASTVRSWAARTEASRSVGVHDGAELRGHSGQQLAVALAKGSVRPPQGTDRLAVRRQGELVEVAGPCARGGQDALAAGDLDVPQAEVDRELGGQRLEQRVDVADVREPAGGAVEDLTRLGPLPEGEAVGCALEALTERREADRHDARRQPWQPRRVLLLEHRADPADDQRVEGSDHQPERAIGQRPVDHEWQVVETALEDRNADRDRQRKCAEAEQPRPCGVAEAGGERDEWRQERDREDEGLLSRQRAAAAVLLDHARRPRARARPGRAAG